MISPRCIFSFDMYVDWGSDPYHIHAHRNGYIYISEMFLYIYREREDTYIPSGNDGGAHFSSAFKLFESSRQLGGAQSPTAFKLPDIRGGHGLIALGTGVDGSRVHAISCVFDLGRGKHGFAASFQGIRRPLALMRGQSPRQLIIDCWEPAPSNLNVAFSDVVIYTNMNRCIGNYA